MSNKINDQNSHSFEVREHTNSLEPISSISPEPLDQNFKFDRKKFNQKLKFDFNRNVPGDIQDEDDEPEFKIETGVPDCVDGSEVNKFEVKITENKLQMNSGMNENELSGESGEHYKKNEDQANEKPITIQPINQFQGPGAQQPIYSVNNTKVIRTQPTSASNNIFIVDSGIYPVVGPSTDCHCCVCCWDGFTDILCFPYRCLCCPFHGDHQSSGGCCDPHRAHGCCNCNGDCGDCSDLDCKCCECTDCGDCGGCDCDCNGCDVGSIDCGNC